MSREARPVGQGATSLKEVEVSTRFIDIFLSCEVFCFVFAGFGLLVFNGSRDLVDRSGSLQSVTASLHFPSLNIGFPAAAQVVC
jgi:hypothetical protein